MDTFGARLRYLRDSRRLRQKDLSGILGLGQTAVANYERNLRFPPAEALVRIADYFDVSLDFLLCREPVPLHTLSAGTAPLTGAQFEAVRTAYLDLVLSGSREEGERLVLSAARQGTGLGTVISRILIPVLQEAGERYAGNRLAVYQEHEISVSVFSLLELLRSRLYAARKEVAQAVEKEPALETGRRTAVCLLPYPELHEAGLKMTALLLEEAGWNVRYFGPHLPVSEAVLAVERSDAAIAVISAVLQEHGEAAAALVRAVRERRGSRTAIVAGGRALDPGASFFTDIGADIYAVSPEDAVRVAAGVIAERQGLNLNGGK